MAKILIPQLGKSVKTSVRGFWKNPAGKIYYDYIVIQEKIINNPYELQKIMSNLKNLYQQEAIFYTEGDKAYIFNSKKDIQELTQQIIKIIPKDKKALKKECQRFLRLYGGFTAYIEPLFYKLEAWTI